MKSVIFNDVLCDIVCVFIDLKKTWTQQPAAFQLTKAKAQGIAW